MYFVFGKVKKNRLSWGKNWNYLKKDVDNPGRKQVFHSKEKETIGKKEHKKYTYQHYSRKAKTKVKNKDYDENLRNL